MLIPLVALALALIPAAMLLGRFAPRAVAPLLSLGAAVLFVAFASMVPAIADGAVPAERLGWVPQLGVDIALRLDGWSLLFALLITGIGALIFLYAGGYFGHSEPEVGRFYPVLTGFMASMLGLVLSDNLLLLFVFWEGTSFTSFLLIGMKHQNESSRAAALQALLVTGGGGLALMAGFILLGFAGGSLLITELAQRGDQIMASPLLFGAFVCIVFGAVTKSAQFPFHFWLPGAMAAPTPVSAYLHSATMVKAGVFLLGTLAPIFVGTPWWTPTLVAFGGVTLVVGGVLALRQDDMKLILAYSTVSALGLLVLMLGIGTPGSLKAVAAFVLGHALYKGALFMGAGSVDHGTGTRLLAKLTGLRRAMPWTAAAIWLGAAGMAGLPPVFGFIAKETVLEAGIASTRLGPVALVLVVVFGALSAGAAFLIAFRPFFGPLQAPHTPHESPPAMLAGPLLLGVIGIAGGLLPWIINPLLQSATRALTARPDYAIELLLWHGFNLALALSVVALVTGALLLLGIRVYQTATGWVVPLSRFGPQRMYERLLAGTLSVARVQTLLLQNGRLRYYMIAVALTTIVLVILAELRTGIDELRAVTDVSPYEWLLAVITMIGAFYAASARSRLHAILGLGIVGYGVALIYLSFSGPDLATTQFLVETLTIILFVLVLSRLPAFTTQSDRGARLRDGLVAGAFGVAMTILVLTIPVRETFPALAQEFIDRSLPEGRGANVVNVILVDFRAMDTMGEITVLVLAAIGVVALLKLRPRERPE